jgi:hypothetical protein
MGRHIAIIVGVPTAQNAQAVWDADMEMARRHCEEMCVDAQQRHHSTGADQATTGFVPSPWLNAPHTKHSINIAKLPTTGHRLN